ncbi:MAG: tRNA (adenosine(37)-N6)-threonylcarbamoyltransferase complex transferase subunit TsaD [Candidatus Sericytochromatia bacterium]|nr:tRNA (adenosine(37)-N6)-threonylcarbamoyltransferase complex transferase subunit TsaD [Candidatus Tanganyikabacteria bacterium]
MAGAPRSGNRPSAGEGLSPLLVLGIESSCDETSVALVADGAVIRANLISSQADVHARFGGVVPEVASRRHIEVVSPLLGEALEKAGATWEDVGAVATTRGPGLAGALLVGMMAAKGIAWARGVPLVGVNHLAAHIWANRMAFPDLPLPFLCLLVSGGHTALVRVEGPGDFRDLGHTRDDAAGEAYDKVARLLDLGYPGGPAIDRLAQTGDPRAFDLPRAFLEGTRDFSFSGLKTAVRRLVEKHRLAGIPLDVAGMAASFQAAVVDVLVGKAIAAAEGEGLAVVGVAGGVAANSALRSRLGEACEERGWRFVCPPFALCTDNAAMIAGLGYELLRLGREDDLAMPAAARFPL